MKTINTDRTDKIRRMLKSNIEYNQMKDESEYLDKKHIDLFDWYAWPGGYVIWYLTSDNGVLCAKCANENFKLCNDYREPQWYIVDCETNDEDHSLYCDNCNQKIYPNCFTEEESDKIERIE